MALTKKKNDVSFINPETMEVECTYNQCYRKFEPIAEEWVQIVYYRSQEDMNRSRALSPFVPKDTYAVNYMVEDMPTEHKDKVLRENYYIECTHKCTECGRKNSNKKDKALSYSSLLGAKSGTPIEVLKENVDKAKR